MSLYSQDSAVYSAVGQPVFLNYPQYRSMPPSVDGERYATAFRQNIQMLSTNPFALTLPDNKPEQISGFSNKILGTVPQVAQDSVKSELEVPVPQTSRVHHAGSRSTPSRWKPLAESVALATLGLLTHQLPIRSRPGRTIIPTDWKAYFRVATGVLATNRLNDAFQVHPPVWLQSIETVGIVHAIMTGLSKRYVRETAVMAPLVAGVVSAANAVNEQITKPLKEEAHIPEVLTKAIVSAGFTAASILALPKLVNQVGRTGLLGKAAKETAQEGRNIMLGSMVVGANCGCGNVVCISMLGDIVGGFGNWVKAQLGGKAPSQKPVADLNTASDLSNQNEQRMTHYVS